MRKHALLSASGASRWLACPPSARLESELYTGQGDEPTTMYADEGTLAHLLGEWLIRTRGWNTEIPEHIWKEISEHEYYSEEMMDYCIEYADFVLNQLREAPAGSILVQEQRLNLVEYIPEGFGHVDNCIVGDDWLTVIDLKYGKGVPVDAYENKQLMVYALGALMEYDILYNIKNVRMIIHQPRIDNNSSYEVSVTDLIRWAREVLVPGARKAYIGEGDLLPGDHCRWCRVRSTCKANAAYNLQIVRREFDPPHLTDDQIVKIINRADSITKWLTSIKEYALSEALQGKVWPGMKLVQGRSVRKITDQDAVLKALEAEGIEGEQVVNKKIAGITQLQKVLPKFVFQKAVEPYLIKPEGKPTLVVEADGRPDWNKVHSAIEDFSDD